MEQQNRLLVIYGFILNEKKELLIVQRAEHDSMPGIWEIPGGGLEMSEHPEKGVRRK